MASLNQCNFIGRVGKDPETRYSTSGDAITNIALAIDESYKNKSSREKVEKCEWVNVTFYRKLAEIAGEYLHKGSLIYVSGKMETRKYTDKNGVERYATNIIAHDMKMLSSKQGQSESNNSERTKTETQSGGFDDMDDDIPW
jgi:single-strand DNA-binding protein